MFDSISLKFNSKQSSTWDLAKEILHLFKHLSSEKGFYYNVADKSNNHIFYHIASQIWQLLQHGMGSQALGKGQWKDKFSPSFSEEAAKKLRINVFSDMIFYSRILQ